MSSWAVILALSGCHFEAAQARVSFNPAINADDFQCFFSTGSAWGRYHQQLVDGNLRVTLYIDYGSLHLKELGVSTNDLVSIANVSVNDTYPSARLRSAQSPVNMLFEPPLDLKANDTVVLNFYMT